MGRRKVTKYQKFKVLTLLQAGLTYQEIRNTLGVSNGCISNIAKKETLNLPLENRPDQGRKKSTTPKDDRHLIILRTVRRRLFNAGYKSYTTKWKPYRKPHHRSARLRFARKYSTWSFNEWKNVIFSDESHFEVFNRKNRSFVRRLPSEADQPFNFQPRVQGGGGSVSVWGVMTAKGVGPLAFYDGRMNGPNYIDVIKPQLLPYIKKNFDSNSSWHYVQDNAPCHKKYMGYHRYKAHFNYHPTTVDELQQLILKLRTEIPVETCQNLVQSISRRLETCIRVKGNTPSKY
ncbi:unnamed protein product [Rotaria sordida]|uniref:Transposase Tc1-like domain-containing protein n=1 Tax=Rotaria sordida TaxID=392033 RepID=A0A819MVW4_9BILA|nr:unnamed protein product [Rotaria sordida]